MEVATTPGYRDISCKDQKVATSVSCRDVSFNEKRSRQDQAVATPASLKACRNHTEAPAKRIVTRTEVATRARCRYSISLLGQLTKVQKEMHRNLGPTLEPYKYAAAKEETQLGGDLKERSGLLKAPVFLFSFLFFSFVFILILF